MAVLILIAQITLLIINITGVVIVILGYHCDDLKKIDMYLKISKILLYIIIGIGVLLILGLILKIVI